MNTEDLQKIIKAAELVNSDLHVNEVLKNIVNVAVELTNADRGTLYLINNEKKELLSLISMGTAQQEIRLKIGEGLAGYVAETGEIINILHAQEDTRFQPDFDLLFGYKTNSMICFPIKNNLNEIIGVLQLLNNKNGIFTKQDEDFLKALSIHSAIALHNALMLQKQISVNKELEIAKHEAEKLAMLKTHFLMQMSHEIRTPLNIILGGIELLRLNLDKSKIEEFSELFQMLDNGSHRIIRTIEEIIEMSAINSGSYELHFESFQLDRDIISPLFKQFEQHAKNRGLQFIFTNATINDTVSRDKYMVYQIIREIIDNSIKFTNKGIITISEYCDEEDRIVISITDTGIGMSDDFLERIFDPFTQEYSGYSRKYEGNGLALALVNKYAELNNLTIIVESKKNVGSEFKIVFN